MSDKYRYALLVIVSSLIGVSFEVFAQENYTFLNRAADRFQKEKVELKNYRVKQEVASKIKETSGSVIEKRFQIGYFRSPDEFIFICRELEINGMKQFLNKPLIERTSKTEWDWLSKEGISLHSFQILSIESNAVKYLVSPKKILTGFFRGQIWIQPDSGRILKIIKEPIIKKKEMMQYMIEVNFDKDYRFQMPSRTILRAVYQVGSRITEVEVDARFQDYEFNIDFSQEIPK
ncbi:MAG TPA: hypothetical protein PK079_17505 [Leptospiraceae bacterium]|nr:hypothetical protein [Leptospiraceae bacterium]HMW06454.1 hypothetical protein [Leptospiraceae bacterium]HMX32444.1 hypothetical protein [Leptospiraceae bacterium]HMY33687.1 hypothetical protein [Leptospiraceae bacterium]HMZ65238.1 hypothetical protein [Leptospiraceae bacterium]